MAGTGVLPEILDVVGDLQGSRAGLILHAVRDDGTSVYVVVTDETLTTEQRVVERQEARRRIRESRERAVPLSMIT